MDNGLRTIDSEYVMPGFASCYLRVQGDEAAFIETNTTHAVPKLLAALEEEGIAREQVRWIVITHVHLDHAGGAAALLEACPNATLIAHPRASRHLIDPSRLIASSEQVYGKETFAKLYGTIEPAPADRVRSMEDGETLDLGGETLAFHYARGHANHHFVVHDPSRDTVYTGDSFGIAYPYLQRAGRFAFASTSPTDFDADEARKSLDLILGLRTQTACLTHYGELDALGTIATQVRRWIDVSEALLDKLPGVAEEEREGFVYEGLRVEMDRAARERGLDLSEKDWELLALDMRINAQGIVFAHSRRARAKD